MNWKELAEIQERIGRLTPAEKLYLIERMAASIRTEHFTDHAAIDRGLEALAADPGVRREIDAWNGSEPHAAR